MRTLTNSLVAIMLAAGASNGCNPASPKEEKAAQQQKDAWNLVRQVEDKLAGDNLYVPESRKAEFLSQIGYNGKVNPATRVSIVPAQGTNIYIVRIGQDNHEVDGKVLREYLFADEEEY